MATHDKKYRRTKTVQKSQQRSKQEPKQKRTLQLKGESDFQSCHIIIFKMSNFQQKRLQNRTIQPTHRKKKFAESISMSPASGHWAVPPCWIKSAPCSLGSYFETKFNTNSIRIPQALERSLVSVSYRSLSLRTNVGKAKEVLKNRIKRDLLFSNTEKRYQHNYKIVQ